MARKPSSLPDSFEPLEIALDAERGDPAPDSPARVLLSEQVKLVRADLRHRSIQIASERVGMVLKGLTGAAGLAAAVALGAMAWTAHNDHGLVIEPFSVPPDMAAKGLTGQVAAARLLDKLTTMQGQTNSERAAESYANNWAADIKVDIPSTGVSIGELDKFLRHWLGHQTHVSGDIVRTPDGRVAVTARVGDTPGEIETGPEADLDALTQKAAESVFAASQPYRYGVWLGENDRGPDGVTYYRRLIARQGPSPERSWDDNGLAQELYNLGDYPGALAAARAAIADDPGSPLGFLVLAEFQLAAGQSQAAHDTYAHGVTLLKAGAGQITPTSRIDQILSFGAVVSEAEGDFVAALSDDQRLSRLPDYNGEPHFALYNAVVDRAQLHDLSGAGRAQALLPAAKSNKLVLGGDDSGLATFAAMLVADAQQDGPKALALANEQTPLVAGGPLPWSTTIAPVKALALARTGDLAAARALIATTPPDCYPCMIARARIEEVAADRPASDSAFAEAVRLAPSLPLAEAAWAKALLNRGDVAGALTKAQSAAAKGPRYADPLEYWGEALLRQGDAKAAEARFKAANAIAPLWGANHMHWGEAILRQGKAGEARAQWLAARGMDLSVGERAWLDHLLAGGR